LFWLKIEKDCSKMENFQEKTDWFWIFEKFLIYVTAFRVFVFGRISYARERIKKTFLSEIGVAVSDRWHSDRKPKFCVVSERERFFNSINPYTPIPSRWKNGFIYTKAQKINYNFWLFSQETSVFWRLNFVVKPWIYNNIHENW
jgi:hypothetical protein